MNLQKHKICFMVPCYNEETNIVPTLETIVELSVARKLNYEILVMDDGSTDKTKEKVEQYAKDHPLIPLRLHSNARNRGLGYNYFLGATLTEAPYYMAVFGDHADPIEALDAIVSRMGEAEMVVPYILDDRVRPLLRRLLSRAFTFLVRLLSGTRLKYYNAGVLHKRSNVVSYNSGGAGFGYQAELLCWLLKNGASYVEVPIPILVRKGGGSKALKISNWIWIFKTFLRLLKMRFAR